MMQAAVRRQVAAQIRCLGLLEGKEGEKGVEETGQEGKRRRTLEQARPSSGGGGGTCMIDISRFH